MNNELNYISVNSLNFDELIFPVAVIFISVFLISQFTLKNIIYSTAIAITKIFLFGLYYYSYYDGSYNSGSDDYFYIFKGRELIQQLQVNLISEIEIINVAETFHFLYICISAFAQLLFGEHYSSLAAVNIMATAPCGLMAYKIIKYQTNNLKIAKLFYTTILVYPDVLAWSTVFSGKDIFVLLGHLFIIYSICHIKNNEKKKGYIYCAISFAYILNFRFYVPFIFLLLLRWRIKYLMALLPFVLLISFYTDLFAPIVSLSRGGFAEMAAFDFATVLEVPYNILRFWVSPRPFSISPEYGYLFVPSLFNWLFLPPLLYGISVILLSKRNEFDRFILYYFMSFSLFYSFVDYLNGPRHRLQLTFALIYIIWVGLRNYNRNGGGRILLVSERKGV